MTAVTRTLAQYAASSRYDDLPEALNAAMINSAASAALAFNDTHYQTVAHPSSQEC